jgi:hypothetical protein
MSDFNIPHAAAQYVAVQLGMPTDAEGFPKRGFDPTWIQAGRESKMSGLACGVPPTPRQVAAGSFVNAQVIGNYALVLRKVIRHRGEQSGGEPAWPHRDEPSGQGGWAYLVL